MARDEISSWFGPPGKGKSALATDLTIANASGRDWRGFRTKCRCGVVYFAFERADLVRRRLIAHKLRDGLADLPIAVAGESIDLLNRSCVDVILATIHAAEQRFACEVGLAIFDTYAKGIAAGGGDEDKAKDQNAVQANLRRLFDRGCHIHIAGVGHAGKDESKGERGSNARLADVDLQVQITGDLVKTATVLKANDQPEGCLTSFKLEPFDFDPDEDGDPFRTFIVGDEILDSDQTQRSRTKPSDRKSSPCARSPRSPWYGGAPHRRNISCHQISAWSPPRPGRRNCCAQTSSTAKPVTPGRGSASFATAWRRGSLSGPGTTSSGYRAPTTAGAKPTVRRAATAKPGRSASSRS